MLTQEYELAKIDEAKEIPTVNVLDAALWPERKSFPPRTIIVVVVSILLRSFLGRPLRDTCRCATPASPLA